MPSLDRMPNEWLLFWASHNEAPRALLGEAGSLSLAAWRLAWARCRTNGLGAGVPSMLEVRGAAREIARRIGDARVPSTREIAVECEAAGLLVI